MKSNIEILRITIRYFVFIYYIFEYNTKPRHYYQVKYLMAVPGVFLVFY